MWRHQLPALEDEWHVLAPDTRGYGGTDKPRERVTRDVLARDIVDLLDAREVERKKVGLRKARRATQYSKR